MALPLGSGTRFFVARVCSSYGGQRALATSRHPSRSRWGRICGTGVRAAVRNSAPLAYLWESDVEPLTDLATEPDDEMNERDSMLVCHGESAWLPPVEPIQSISKRFPKLEFELHYDESNHLLSGNVDFKG